MAFFRTKDLGKAGELEAERFLRRAGYRILGRNYAKPFGELDLICYHEGCLVFVEVKCRAEDVATDPENNITPGKQRRMEKAARAWIAERGEPDCSYRFDAVSVILPPQGQPRIRHIIDAFIPAR